MKKTLLLYLTLICHFLLFAQNQNNNIASNSNESELQNAVSELNNFLTGKTAALFTNGKKSYFAKVFMENPSTLRFNYVGTDFETIRLEWVDEIYIEDISKEKPVLLVNSVEKGAYCCGNYEYRYSNKTLWAQLSNRDCKKFYLLLGNVLDEYRKANDKHYKVEQTYQDRVDLMNSPIFLEKIEKGSIVRVEDAYKKAFNHKKLNYKKLKGAEVTVVYLDIDHSYQTYKGKILVNDWEYNVEELKITFIKDKDGNDLATYKAKLESDIKKVEQNDDAKDEELKTQWHPVSKLLQEFVDDAKQINGLEKYNKSGTELQIANAGLNYKYYRLSKFNAYTKYLSYIDFAKRITTDSDKKNGNFIAVWFNKEYVDKYIDFLKFQAPILKTEKNPNTIHWQEKENKQGFLLFYKHKVLMDLDTSGNFNTNKQIYVLFIKEFIE